MKCIETTEAPSVFESEFVFEEKSVMKITRLSWGANVFEKLSFCVGLVWMVCPTEIKLRLQIPLALSERCMSREYLCVVGWEPEEVHPSLSVFLLVVAATSYNIHLKTRISLNHNYNWFSQWRNQRQKIAVVSTRISAWLSVRTSLLLAWTGGMKMNSPNK